jgi:hypothetical protein
MSNGGFSDGVVSARGCGRDAEVADAALQAMVRPLSSSGVMSVAVHGAYLYCPFGRETQFVDRTIQGASGIFLALSVCNRAPFDPSFRWHYCAKPVLAVGYAGGGIVDEPLCRYSCTGGV